MLGTGGGECRRRERQSLLKCFPEIDFDYLPPSLLQKGAHYARADSGAQATGLDAHSFPNPRRLISSLLWGPQGRT